METKEMIIAIIKDRNKILLRKKPEGIGPYKESWYLFGTELSNKESLNKTIEKSIKEQIGINVNFKEKVGEDTEIKKDYDNKEKMFIYLDCICNYVSGQPILPIGIEKIEWVNMTELKKYDLVPPTKKLFKKLGYL